MSLTLTTILGQDNPSQSRTLINSHFSTISSAINNIETFLNYSNGEAALKKCTINLPTISTPITTNLLSCAGSGNVSGNLVIGLKTTTTELLVTTGGGKVDGGDFEVVQSSNKLISRGTFESYGKIKFSYSTLLDSTAYSALTTGQYTPNTYITQLSCTGNLTLLAGEEGQHIKLYMIGNGPVNIQTTNLTSIITAPIILNAKGQILDLWYKSGKWHVIGKNGSFTITYAP